jgi:hypothetical protein
MLENPYISTMIFAMAIILPAVIALLIFAKFMLRSKKK